MQLMEVPLPPLPTTPPHPRDVSRKLLLARQGAVATCGWIDGDFANPITCNPGDACGQNTFLEAVYCCASASFPFNCGVIPTACVNSAYVASSCTGFCLSDPSTVRCTLPGAAQCVEELYDDATLSTYITGYACNSVRTTLTAYDRYTLQGGATTTVIDIRPAISTSTSSNTMGNVVTSPVPNPIPVVTPISSPTSSSLSGGAIAGIAIGAFIGLAIIAGLLALLFFQRRKRDRRQTPAPNPNPTPMIHTDPNPPLSNLPPHSPPPPTSPLLDNGRTSFMSNPSATSTTPLTQNNIATVSHTPSDIRPQDSASNVGGYSGSALSNTAPPTYHSSAGSQEHSGLGPLPGPQYPTGSAAFPNQNTPSVMSPGSAFGSMPPGVHAPSV